MAKVTPEATWRDRLILNPGDVLSKTGTIKRGNLDQCEGETFNVIDAQGQTVGTVVYIASTSLKPRHRTSYSVQQEDIAGKVIVDTRW